MALGKLALGCAALTLSGTAAAQSAIDRAARATQGESDRPAAPHSQAVAPVPVDVADDAAPPAVSGEAPVAVGAIKLVGLQALTPADFSDILGDYVGKTCSTADLQALATRLTQRARARGYVFASASIAPQRLVAGILAAYVDEGRIAHVRIEGSDRAALHATLDPLADGRPVTMAELERQLMLASDIDGIAIRHTRYAREQGLGVLTVQVSADRVRGRVVVSNDGTRPFGPEQVRIELGAGSLLAADDWVSFTAGSSFEPGEVAYARLRYKLRMGADGTELALSGSFATTHPGSYLAPHDLVGHDGFLGVSMLRPLLRRHSRSIWLSAGLDLRDARQWSHGIGIQRDRIVAARLGLYGYERFAGGNLRFNALLSQGLPLLDATDLDPGASRWLARDDFTSASIWADWTRPIGGGFGVKLAGQVQVASGPLFIAEQIGLGGGPFLRGYDYGERSGDEGVMGSAELQYSLPTGDAGAVRRAQFYAFVDGGKVEYLGGGCCGGALASGGGGLRADLAHGLGATLEVAVPMTGPRYDTGHADPKVNVAIAKAF